MRQLGPVLFLPGAIYFTVRPHSSVVVALAAASSVPVLDGIVRLLQRKPLTAAGMLFILFAAVSATLAIVLNSPMFVLAKGAVISGALGLAFWFSAVIGRPLTRTIALRLSAEHSEHRHHLAERWRHPKAVVVFKNLSRGWGALLLASGAQQGIMAMTLPPGVVMAVDPPVHAALTLLGVVVSVAYVRRSQRHCPEVSLLALHAER